MNEGQTELSEQILWKEMFMSCNEEHLRWRHINPSNMGPVFDSPLLQVKECNGQLLQMIVRLTFIPKGNTIWPSQYSKLRTGMMFQSAFYHPMAWKSSLSRLNVQAALLELRAERKFNSFPWKFCYKADRLFVVLVFFFCFWVLSYPGQETLRNWI